MDSKDSERYFRGYIFLPCCTEECCRNQSHSFQAGSSFYPSSFPKYEAILPEQSRSVQAHSSRFSSHTRDAGYRVLFPAVQKERPQPYEISRQNFGLESQLPSALRGNYFHSQRSWKLEAGCKPKRNRTIFTADQLERLEKEFDRQQYIVGTQRFYLAADLGLNETQVKVWFQNRRIKWRRQHFESDLRVERSRFERNEEERNL